MKKLVLSLMACAAILASCDGVGGSKSRLQAENDSLQAALNERDAELDAMMGTFNASPKASAKSMRPKTASTCNAAP